MLRPVTSSMLLKCANGHACAAAPETRKDLAAAVTLSQHLGRGTGGPNSPRHCWLQVREEHTSQLCFPEGRSCSRLLVEFWKRNDPAGDGSQSNTTQRGLGKGEGAGELLCSQALCTGFCPPAFPETQRGSLPLNLLHTR